MEYVHQALAIDREGDTPITYRLSSSANWPPKPGVTGPVIDTQIGTITWTPNTEGRFGLSVDATDSLGRQEYLPEGYELIEAWDRLDSHWQQYVRQIKQDYMHLIEAE